VSAETAINLQGATEGVVVIITSAIFAFIGKSMRNSGVSLGKVI
jgi:hypothetical protein